MSILGNVKLLKNKGKKPVKKGFRVIDVVLFTFSAVFVLDSLGLSTTIGWSSILWWIILGIMFFLPYGMITAELSTTYSSGGIYEWVKRGLGFKNGARSNYCYWLNVAFWMPSVYLILGSTFVYSIDPSVVEQEWFIWVNVGIAIVATWLTMFFNSLNLDKVKWLPNAGAIIKGFLVFMMIISMIVFLVNPDLYGGQNQYSGITNIEATNVATDVNGDFGIIPNFGSTLGIIGIIVYNLCGFELSQNLGDDIQEVKKSVPKALLIGGATILLSYLIASVPVFITNDVSLEGYQDSGYQNTVITTLLSGLPKEFVIVLAILLAFTLFTNMLTWTLGANAAMQEAAESGQFPKIFAKRNSNKAPVSAALILTIISNVAILLSGIMEFFGAGSAYFILFSFSLIIFFIPYMFIFMSYVKLRVIDAHVTRPFGIKNNFIAQFSGILCLIIVIIACLTQVLDIQIGTQVTIEPYPDLGGWGGFFGTVGGVVLSLIVGDILIWQANKKPISKKPKEVIKQSSINESSFKQNDFKDKLIKKIVLSKNYNYRKDFNYVKTC